MLKLQKISALFSKNLLYFLPEFLPELTYNREIHPKSVITPGLSLPANDHEAVGGKCGVGQGFREQGRSGDRLGKLAGVGAEIAPNRNVRSIKASAVGKKLQAIGDKQLEIAPFEDVTSFAQGNQATVKVQDGVFVLPGAL